MSLFDKLPLSQEGGMGPVPPETGKPTLHRAPEKSSNPSWPKRVGLMDHGLKASAEDTIHGETQASLVPLTILDVQRALPNHLRNNVNQDLVDRLNQVAADPVICENIRHNFMGYSGILKNGGFKTEEYINAVVYVSFKLMGYTNLEAYSRTFPNRYATLLARGTVSKDIAGFVSAYNRGKLVNLIMEQSLVPTWVLNQDLFQKALNVQADLMMNSTSDKVKTDAANSLLQHLKKPEVKEFQISMDTNESAGIKEMRGMLQQLAQQQREFIERGDMKTIDVAATRLVVEDE